MRIEGSFNSSMKGWPEGSTGAQVGGTTIRDKEEGFSAEKKWVQRTNKKKGLQEIPQRDKMRWQKQHTDGKSNQITDMMRCSVPRKMKTALS